MIDLDIARCIQAETRVLGPQPAERTLRIATYAIGSIHRCLIYADAFPPEQAKVYRLHAVDEISDAVTQLHMLYEKMRHEFREYRSVSWEELQARGMDKQLQRMTELRRKKEER